MPAWIINLGAKLAGVGKLWGVLDGYKTKIAGIAGILTGLGGLVLEVNDLIAKHDAAAVLAFVKHLPADQAWLTFLSGLAALGLRHAIQKAADGPVEALKP